MSGTSNEFEFFNNVTMKKVRNSLEDNYLTTACAARTVLEIWTEDDIAKAHLHHLRPRLRQIVLISSASASLGMPAYNGKLISKDFFFNRPRLY